MGWISLLLYYVVSIMTLLATKSMIPTRRKSSLMLAGAAVLLLTLGLPIHGFSWGPYFSPSRASLCTSNSRHPQAQLRIHSSFLQSSFYEDFEEFENNDDDDDDDEEEEDYPDDYDDASVQDFRSKMGALFGEKDAAAGNGKSSSPSVPSPVQDVASVDELIRYARSTSKDEDQGASTATPAEPADWAHIAAKALEPGNVLIANPAKFCDSKYSNLLSKFGLTVPPPKDLGADRRADLLPVVLLVDQDLLRGSRGVLLNRRTGYLLGDLESSVPPGATSSSNPPTSSTPLLEKFCIQPLWFGGVENLSAGLDMLHQCPTVPGCKPLTADGLFWGGDPAQAEEAMEDPSLDRVYTGFDFKFFVQTTLWNPLVLQREVDQKVWFVAKVSKSVLFKSRDRAGTRRAKPLWTEIMELLGGEYADVKEDFYRETNEGSSSDSQS